MPSTMPTRHARILAIAVAASFFAGCSLSPAKAPDPARPLPGEGAPGPVVDPDISRPNVQIRRIRSENIEAGIYAGAIVIDSALVPGTIGLRLAYHLTEDFWTEANYTFATRHGFRSAAKFLGADAPPPTGYHAVGLSLGYDVLPGDLYFSDRYSIPLDVYLVGGGGHVSYKSYEEPAGDRFFDFDGGGGVKLLPTDWLSLRFELRDQVWARHRLEQTLLFNLGLAAFF